MSEVDFVSANHQKTRRDYRERVVRGDKAQCARVAKEFGRDYWDGDRKHGYGGFRYDGRWQEPARRMIEHYRLKAGMKVLDVGCGKGYLLADLVEQCPGLEVCGIDVSGYALEHSHEAVRPFLSQAGAQELPFAEGEFDLVISINTLHNLPIYDLKTALGEITRVMAERAYVAVESYRSEEEKDNLLNWQLTCESVFSVREWRWIFQEFGYRGDYSFIFFE